jgi:micrococcal nuclease
MFCDIDDIYPHRIRPMKSLFLTIFITFLSVSCSNSQILKCTRAIDGDTIVVNNDETIMLIGVDTPENKHPQKPVEYYGKGAK